MAQTTAAIMGFLAAKGTEEFKNDKDKFNDFPIDLVVGGKQQTGYIQDVERKFSKNKHSVKVVVLIAGSILVVEKSCVAPEGCEIDWDTVQCTTEISDAPQAPAV